MQRKWAARKPAHKLKTKRFYLIILSCTILTTIAILLPIGILRLSVQNVSFNSRFLFSTPGCSIPDLSQFNFIVKNYFFKAAPIVCNRNIGPLFKSNSTSIYLVESRLEDYYVTVNNLRCCYQYFKRRSPRRGEPDKKVTYSKCFHLYKFVHVDENEEFVRLVCRDITFMVHVIYEDYFHFIPNKISENDTQVEIGNNLDDDYLNVIILGIDSVSRMNMHRQMPKTIEFLSTMEAVEMMGYIKIGDSSFPNLIAMLSGQNSTEVKDCCTGNPCYFDDCKFIWNKFKENGYVTVYGEDSAKHGLFVFNTVNGNGFFKQPTDYNYNHFDYVAEKAFSDKRCIGSKLTSQVLLDYATKFLRKIYPTHKKFFGFFWTSILTHDLINPGNQVDNMYSTWLRNLKKTGIFNNSMLIVMSDHGMRFGDFRMTYQGVLEDSLPFMSISLPKWFREKYSLLNKVLQINTQRLVTTYDLFETLVDILSIPQSEKLTNETSAADVVDFASEKPKDFHLREGNIIDGIQRGISLFTSISDERTCSDAGIASHWCACNQGTPVNVNEHNIAQIVEYVIHAHINPILVKFPACYRLTLSETLQAQIYQPKTNNEYRKVNGTMKKSTENARNSTSKKSVWEDIKVRFSTNPNRGIFEATVRVTTAGKEKKLEMSGTVSRLNSYKGQSDCIRDKYAAMFCYCKQK